MQRSHRAARLAGFTLIELLAVIAIIGLLIALLLPAVQSAREAARRSQCTNNLKQIGLALENYESYKKVFPSGYVSQYTANGTDTGPGWGWATLILPMLEETALANQLNLNLPIENAANSPAITTPLSEYLCPSEEREPVWAAMSQSGGTKICDVAEAAYVAMFGTTEPGIDGNGMFFRNSTVHVREITDGSTQTIAAGERADVLGEATWVGSVTGAYLAPDPLDNDGIGIFEQEEGSTMVLGQSGEGKSPGDPTGEPDMFYSLHPGGVNFVFADGHVTFLMNTMDPQLFQALCIRAGGEVIADESSF
ncbi:MAG TPA: DUF1559 domain-containing protein [Pirellulales bacterium]|nr:DUF1559 domain-containing protein [Pirellulales bacterium]